MGGHKGFVLWFTGLSGAGKSTLAERLVAEFKGRSYRVELLDGDEILHAPYPKVSAFPKEDRDGETSGELAGWRVCTCA